MNNVKKVLITGGSGDIAQAVKTLLEVSGYEVFAPTREILDVTKPETIEKTVKDFLPDILINSAGFVKPQSVKKGDLNLSKRHIEINLCGLFYCTEIALKYNPELQVVNIGSAAAIEPHATWSEYCATKAGVVMATKCWSEDGIHTTCISPGRTKTKMRKSLFPDEDPDTLLLPEDFAKIVLFAVEKRYESGSHIIVRKQNVEQLIAEKTGN